MWLQNSQVQIIATIIGYSACRGPWQVGQHWLPARLSVLDWCFLSAKFDYLTDLAWNYSNVVIESQMNRRTNV
jgi:hypothetical protein